VTDPEYPEDRVRVRPEAVSRRPGQLDLRPLPNLIGYALRRTQVAVFNRFRRAFAEFDIRPAQLGILTVVHNNPGLKPSEVSAALGIKRTNLVPLLDGLIARGLIERAKLETDRRSHALRLTQDGSRFLAALQQREAEFERDLSAAIGDADRLRLLHLLAEVEASCRDEPEPAEE
jgi:DNA-binding MarR family transcriptional regulator